MIMPHLPGKYKEVLSCLKLLDLDEDLERLTWGVQAARAVSAAISLDHAYGEGLYAVSDYLYEVQEKMRGDLDLCLAQVREGQ